MSFNKIQDDDPEQESFLVEIFQIYSGSMFSGSPCSLRCLHGVLCLEASALLSSQLIRHSEWQEEKNSTLADQSGPRSGHQTAVCVWLEMLNTAQIYDWIASFHHRW